MGQGQGSSSERLLLATGYGAFSTISARLPALRRYIAAQEEHHKKESFKDEYRRLLKEYNVEYDERYIWD